MTMTATKAFQQVRAAVEAIRTDATEEIATMSAGDVVRQGDIYVICLGDATIASGKPHGRQLAPGSTQGSRHVAEGDCEVYEPASEQAALDVLHRLVPATKHHRQFLGPVIEARGPATIAHPEHGDRVLPPGSYLVTYQRAWADEIRRQMD